MESSSPTPLPHLGNARVLGMRVDATSYEDAVERCVAWSREERARYVCISTVHMTMESYDDPGFLDVVNGADLVTPDGMPLVWSLRRLGYPGQTRVYGPTLTLHLCQAAAAQRIPVGFYGASPEALARLKSNLMRLFPRLEIAYAHSPPFRQLSLEEDEGIVSDIRESGARILFVGLGCPRQERWMAAHTDKLPLVMLGVGAAFDFHAGLVRQAPNWIQDLGMEWAFRLLMEPRRLWRRYLRHNPRFVWLVARERVMARHCRGTRRPGGT